MAVGPMVVRVIQAPQNSKAIERSGREERVRFVPTPPEEQKEFLLNRDLRMMTDPINLRQNRTVRPPELPRIEIQRGTVNEADFQHLGGLPPVGVHSFRPLTHTEIASVSDDSVLAEIPKVL
ncbi:hypothetical protein DFH06DRAFT_1148118 [Mycena polygramma]|nr:hypothetical protein DFH06DRAFT_1148118 [Mycena polygramma]